MIAKAPSVVALTEGEILQAWLKKTTPARDADERRKAKEENVQKAQRGFLARKSLQRAVTARRFVGMPLPVARVSPRESEPAPAPSGGGAPAPP